MKSTVYFIKEINSDNLIKLFEILNIKLKGKVACKVHSGEKGNQNFIKPEFFKPLIDKVNGRVIECNTAYEGSRNTTTKHIQTLKEHNWSKYFDVDLMDKDGEDLILDIPNGIEIKKDYVGKNLANYDSLLVLSHFKGHPMGGFGGALKQLSIGIASSYGKAYIHGAGDVSKIWTQDQQRFLQAMADAASSVYNKFKNNCAFINVMCNLSVDCDCCAVAEDPCMKDIGMLASLDPVALDKACLDLIYNSKDKGKEHFIERVESRKGQLIIDDCLKLNFGNKEYNLIELK